jgi:hypothetical protein
VSIDAKENSTTHLPVNETDSTYARRRAGRLTEQAREQLGEALAMLQLTESSHTADEARILRRARQEASEAAELLNRTGPEGP